MMEHSWKDDDDDVRALGIRYWNAPYFFFFFSIDDDYDDRRCEYNVVVLVSIGIMETECYFEK